MKTANDWAAEMRRSAQCMRDAGETEVADGNDAVAELLEQASKGLNAVLALMNDSRGVAGLHRNGDEAPWNDLRTGGSYESWLSEFDDACVKFGLVVVEDDAGRA